MKKIYIVEQNADFTEGRGPMFFHSAWSKGEDAIKYVEKQGGIYGSPQNVERDKFGYFAYANGYQIKEVVLLDSLAEFEDAEKIETQKRALNKLTAEERKALGF